MTPFDRQALTDAYVDDAFSSFLAMRRAIRSTEESTTASGGARLFGLFTDTTSRVGNFQPPNRTTIRFARYGPILEILGNSVLPFIVSPQLTRQHGASQGNF